MLLWQRLKKVWCFCREAPSWWYARNPFPRWYRQDLVPWRPTAKLLPWWNCCQVIKVRRHIGVCMGLIPFPFPPRFHFIIPFLSPPKGFLIIPTHSYRNSWQVPWKISTNPSERLTKSQPSSDLFIFFWPIPPTPTNLFLRQILLSKPTHCFFLLTYLTLWCKVKHTDFFLFFLLFLYCLQKWRENSRVHKRPTWDPHVAVQAEDLPWWNC